MNSKNNERIDGPTPNGGAYAIAYYFDKNDNPCPPEKAYRVEVVEYDNKGNRINSTYSFL